MISKVIEDSVIEALARRNVGSAIQELRETAEALLKAPNASCCAGKKERRGLLDTMRQQIATLSEDRRTVFKQFMKADQITIYYKDGDGSKKLVF